MKKVLIVMLQVIVTTLVAQQHGDIRSFAITEKVSIDMIWIEPGEFLMGSPETELERKAELEQQHLVTLTKGFWMAQTETEQSVWEEVMKSNPSLIKRPDHPVEQVSWNMVQDFIRKINQQGAQFRLPTEAEWEYACRAGTTGAYAGARDAMTWHRGNSSRSTHPVGTKMPNAWGLYNMHGNVSERCQDWFQEDITMFTVDPKGPETGIRRVERGGQYTGRLRHTRSADRSAAPPDNAAFFVGFRLVHD